MRLYGLRNPLEIRDVNKIKTINMALKKCKLIYRNQNRYQNFCDKTNVNYLVQQAGMYYRLEYLANSNRYRLIANRYYIRRDNRYDTTSTASVRQQVQGNLRLAIGLRILSIHDTDQCVCIYFSFCVSSYLTLLYE